MLAARSKVACWLDRQGALTRGAPAEVGDANSPAIFTECHSTSEIGIRGYYWCSSLTIFLHLALDNKMARCFVT